MDIHGAVGIVTGGASGLGAATAARLSGVGVEVVVVDVANSLGSELARSIGGHYVHADVSDTDQVTSAVEAAIGLGPLRILVNCAGLARAGATIGQDGAYASAHGLAEFDLLHTINVTGTFNCIRIAATAMGRIRPLTDGERGAIVNVSSVAAFEGPAGQVAYSASKGAIASMTLPLARDLAPIGVRVNAIAPGLMDTPIFGTGPRAERFKARLMQDVLFPQRLGRPGEFASLVLELVTNSYINGAVLRLDAGVRLGSR